MKDSEKFEQDISPSIMHCVLAYRKCEERGLNPDYCLSQLKVCAKAALSGRNLNSLKGKDRYDPATAVVGNFVVSLKKGKNIEGRAENFAHNKRGEFPNLT